jgi:hypothetical protein
MGSGVSFEILVQPSNEPLTLVDAKKYLRVDYSDEDDVITAFITDARAYAEQITKRSLASQTIRATIEPPMIPEGELSGPIGGDFDPYRLNERITTVPFGFYGPTFALPMPPVTAVTVVEYQLTPFDGQPAAGMQWTNLAAEDNNGYANWLLDTNTSPHSVVLRPLLVSNRYRITYTTQATPAPYYPLISSQLKALVAFWYDNRDGQPIPDGITAALARQRIFKL